MKKLIFAAMAVALIAAGCGKKTKPASLYSHNWELYEVVSKIATDASPTTETPPMGITLVFSDSLKVASGNGGCNRYTTPYEMGDSNTISFSMPVRTQMACADMEFETRYLEWLTTIESYTVTNEELQLKSNNITLVYRPEFK